MRLRRFILSSNHLGLASQETDAIASRLELGVGIDPHLGLASQAIGCRRFATGERNVVSQNTPKETALG